MPEPLIALDSVTHLTEEHRGKAVYCASHGGAYAGYCAAKSGIGAIILSDAGIGREQSGIAGLGLLDDLGVPAAAISHQSARIGDGADGLRRGVVSKVNKTAREHGIRAGVSCMIAMEQMQALELTPSPPPPPMSEARFEEASAGREGVRVIISDSNSLVEPGDVGHVFISGSHGGLLGGRPETAVKQPVFAAIYCDADRGCDNAGVSRLPALDAQGIAAACVSVFSARIGDGRSIYEDGFISVVNATAARRGGAVGQSCREFVDLMVEARILQKSEETE